VTYMPKPDGRDAVARPCHGWGVRLNLSTRHISPLMSSRRRSWRGPPGLAACHSSLSTRPCRQWCALAEKGTLVAMLTCSLAHLRQTCTAPPCSHPLIPSRSSAHHIGGSRCDHGLGRAHVVDRQP
jgi:hypothetical protein